MLGGCEARDPLERAIASQNLEDGIIVYGRAGEEPQTLAFGGDARREYRYWSLSKPITAAVVMRMAQDDPSLLDRKTNGATIRELLAHTGGWDQSVDGDPIGLDADRCSEPGIMVAEFAPGTDQVYSNYDYCLIGAFLADYTGKPFPELVREMIPQTRDMAYDPTLGAAGGWSGNALDYWQFASAPVSPDYFKRPPGAPDDGPFYAISWRVDGEVLSHFGMIYGKSYALVVKRGEFSAVALFDTAPADPFIARDVLTPALLALESGA